MIISLKSVRWVVALGLAVFAVAAFLPKANVSNVPGIVASDDPKGGTGG